LVAIIQMICGLPREIAALNLRFDALYRSDPPQPWLNAFH
jgi:hypothetical protein